MKRYAKLIRNYKKQGIKNLCDNKMELHAQPNRELYDVMTFGAGATRKEPLWWVITTAGDDPDRHSIGWEIHDYAKRIQDGEIEDATWYAKIYCADEEDDIWDEATWYKANPGLGTTINIEAVREEATTAKNNPANEKLFRWLRLNQWISLKTVGWLDLSLWDSTLGKWDKSELLGKKCYIGLDLASTSDLTGLVLLFPPQDGIREWRFISEGWIPDENMKQRVITDHAPYEKFVREGWLHTTPGNVADYDYIEERIKYYDSIYKLKYLCPDPWNSRMLTQRLEKCGINIIEVSQNIAMMSPSMKEIERLLKSNMMEHEQNDLARWCFGNVNIYVDGNENIKPMKNKSRERIDITVALINAMAIAIKFEQKTSVYENRGMRIM
jgi:phage terminase large subunit-like protein